MILNSGIVTIKILILLIFLTWETYLVIRKDLKISLDILEGIGGYWKTVTDVSTNCR